MLIKYINTALGIILIQALMLIVSAHAEVIEWEVSLGEYNPVITQELSDGNILVGYNDVNKFTILGPNGSFIDDYSFSDQDDRATAFIEIPNAGVVYIATHKAFYYSEDGICNMYVYDMASCNLDGPYYSGHFIKDSVLIDNKIILTDGGEDIYPGQHGSSLLAFDRNSYQLTTIYDFGSEPTEIECDVAAREVYVTVPEIATIFKFDCTSQEVEDWFLEDAVAIPDVELIYGISLDNINGKLYATAPEEKEIIEISTDPFHVLNVYNFEREIIDVVRAENGESLLGICFGGYNDGENQGLIKIHLQDMSTNFFPGGHKVIYMKGNEKSSVVYGVFKTSVHGDFAGLALDELGNTYTFALGEDYRYLSISILDEYSAFIASGETGLVKKIILK